MQHATTILEPSIVHLDRQPTVAVRLQPAWADTDMPALFDRCLPMIGERLRSAGVHPGIPFARYFRFGPSGVDVEIGVPVERRPDGIASLSEVAPGEVGTSELPGGLAARAVHVGPYPTLSATYDALHDWIGEQRNVAALDGPWESYLDNPAEVADVATLRTEVLWPLREA